MSEPAWKKSLEAKLRDFNFDPTRAKCIRTDGSVVALPFLKQPGLTKLKINGRWLPLIMVRGEFHCGPLTFTRIYYPETNRE